jgi:preprotein translocase subunit SecY
MAFREFLSAVSTVLPEVPKPSRKPSMSERLIWTGIALLLFFIMTETPLYGVSSQQADRLAFSRVIFASAQGSLMELGIGPIVTAGLILQLLKGSEIIRLDFSKPEDRALFTSATKFLTLLVGAGEATAFILGGLFGVGITASVGVVIVLQLLAATVIVMLLDETVQKGWGLGSGISLFIMGGVAQRIMWDLFSIAPVGTTLEMFGVFPRLIQAIAQGDASAVLFRDFRLPSIYGLLLTILTVLIIVYISGVRVEIPITSTRFRGFSGVYPMKLMYVSNVPVILASALLTNIIFFSQYVFFSWNRAGNNPWLNLLGVWDPGNLNKGPISGLAYYLTSPRNFSEAPADPLRAASYIGFFVLISVLFAKTWVELGGLSPKSVAKSLLDAKVQVPGFRRASDPLEELLGRFIPVITVLGGVLVGLLASVPDFLGVFGGGIGILLMVDILVQYYQILARERIAEEMPAIAELIGVERR